MTHYEYVSDDDDRINGAMNPYMERYFHGRITRDESERRLLNCDPTINGLFLLREHLHLDGYFVLSMCFRGHVKHYVLERQYNTGMVSIEGSHRKFIGPVELVQAYLQFGKDHTSGLPCKLEQPCFLTTGASPRFFTGLSQETIKEEMFGVARAHGLTEEEIARALNTFKRSEFEKLMKKFINRNRVWYHGVISKRTAEKRLAKSGLQNGRFLVREKGKNSGRCSLSVCYKRSVHHYNIKKETVIGQVSIEGGGFFDSLMALIDFYEMKDDEIVCSLTHPCARSGAGVAPETVKMTEVFRAILSVGVIHPGDIASVSLALPPMVERSPIPDLEQQQNLIPPPSAGMGPGMVGPGMMGPGMMGPGPGMGPGMGQVQRSQSWSSPATSPADRQGLYASMYGNNNNIAKKDNPQRYPSQLSRLVQLPSIDEDKEKEEDDDDNDEDKEEVYGEVFSAPDPKTTINVVYNKRAPIKYY